MASRMRSLLSLRKNVRKGQFFVLTSVAIVTILFFVSRWIGPSTQIDTSAIVLSDELFTFDNIKEKVSDVVKSSENCDDFTYNLQEYENFINNFAGEKNYKIEFSYINTPCSEELGAVAEFSLRILSEKADAKGVFYATWP